MGFWQATQPDEGWGKLLLVPPNFDGNDDGQTTTVSESAGNQKTDVTWLWHEGNYNQPGPTPSTDPCPNRCGCILYQTGFDCIDDLEANWDVSAGTFNIVADSTLWKPSGTGNPGQVQWTWDATTKTWAATDNGCQCRAVIDSPTSPIGSPCGPTKPAPPSDTTEDGQTTYTDCDTTGHLTMTSNAKALVKYGETKTNDLFVCVEVLNAHRQDEFRIYFDGGNQYAYFKFGNWEDGTQPGPFTGTFASVATAWPNEGQFGIYDGSNLRTKHSTYMYPYPNGSRFFGLWIHDDEEGNHQIATAIIGNDGEVTSGMGPGYVKDAMSAKVTVSSADVGLGSGTISEGTGIDRFSVQEAKRNWTHLDYKNPINCYSGRDGQGNRIDPYNACQGGEIERLDCLDGLAPTSITVEIGGFQPLWESYNNNTATWHVANSDPGISDTYPNEVYTTGCPSCSSLNGTYVLQRSDLCIVEACGAGAYVYEGSIGCGDFTITLDWNNGYISGSPYAVNLSIEIWNRKTPLTFLDGSGYDGARGYGLGNAVIGDTRNRLDPFKVLQGQALTPPAAGPTKTQSWFGWYDKNGSNGQQIFTACCNATFTITAVAYE